MITRITIENFKGIRDRLELDLRPITLLFGANSSGKSTVMHALHYAREIFERHNLDTDKTISGGPFIDLGGFGNFVHDRDRTAKVRIGIELSLEQIELPTFSPMLAGYQDLGSRWDTALNNAKTAGVEVQIAWSDQLNGPYVEQYQSMLDGKVVASIISTPGRQSCVLTVNPRHPSLMSIVEANELLDHEIPHFESFDDQDPVLLALCDMADAEQLIPGMSKFKDAAADDEDDTFEEGFSFEVRPHFHALPSMDSMFDLGVAFEDGWESNPGPTAYCLHYLSNVISEIVAGPGQLVREELKKLRYLGPLRETPSRNYQPPRYPQMNRWATGLGAWDALQLGNDDFVQAVSDWLGDEDRLAAGYRVERKRFVELDLSDPLVVKLLTGRAFDEADEDETLDLTNQPEHSRIVIVPEGTNLELQPHDVGIGISQVLPVIVTALQGRERVLAIEQPELHLHPKLQAELGDLFIEAALGERRHTVILETHSELIPLRLMRRIRETNDGAFDRSPAPITSHDVAIYYVEAFEGTTITTHLELSQQGQLLDPWPDGFFEEGFRERFAE